MAKPKKKSKADSLAIKGSFADVIKVSVQSDKKQKPAKKPAKKKD